METPVGRVPRVLSALTSADRWGTIKARWGVGRMNYCIDPGLYALGNPSQESPVLVTSNYKMSFDRLRAALPGRDAWILVLDTNGINVWCSAGKGAFGTEELVGRIKSSGLERVVTHSRVILPQLSAPGVAAYRVKKLSGFEAIYGPIRAEDLPAFLDAGCKATPEMRIKSFPVRERVVLIPVELVEAMKAAVFIMPALFLLGGLGGPGTFWANAANYGLFSVLAFVAALLGGVVFSPLLLPWIPGRAFAFKGMLVGLASALVVLFFRSAEMATRAGKIELLAWLLLIPAIASYLAMNFTGASTYTSLSGVKREMRYAVPLQIAAAAIGLGLWIGSRFMA